MRFTLRALGCLLPFLVLQVTLLLSPLPPFTCSLVIEIQLRPMNFFELRALVREAQKRPQILFHSEVPDTTLPKPMAKSVRSPSLRVFVKDSTTSS